MKAIALKPGTTHLRLAEWEEPKLQTPSQIKVEVLEVGICGTDREEASGGRADAPIGEKELIIGHEMLSRVIEVGKEVKLVKKGDLVVIMVRRGCNLCKPCKFNHFDLCETGKYTERGIKQRHGYQAQFVVEEQEYVIPVPEKIRSLAVLTEPTTVVEKAIDEAKKIQLSRLPYETNQNWLEGKKVLVAGLGPIGLLAAMILRLNNAQVYGLDIVDPTSFRPKILKDLGGEYIKSGSLSLQEWQKKHPQIDMIIEAAGITKLDFDLIHLLGYNGIYVLTGVPGDDRPLNVKGGEIMRQLVLKNQIILGSVNAGKKHFLQAVKDLEAAEKKWPNLIEKLITSRTPYHEFDKVLSHHTADEIKAVITWGH